MRKVIFLVIITIIFSACNTLDKEGYYASTKEGFSIKPPEGWQVMEDYNDFIPLSFVSPRENDSDIFVENIEVIRTIQEEKLNLEEYYELHLETMKSKYPDYKIIDSGKNKNATEKNLWTINTYTIDGLRFKCVTYYFTKKEKGIVVNCTTNPASFDKYRPVFDEVCTTFCFD